MKTKLTVILPALMLSLAAHTLGCADVACETECCEPEPQPLIELKAGYFFFTDSKMQHVYDHGGYDVQISGSYPIYCFLHLYGSVEYLEKSGQSSGGHQRTFLWEIPLSLGLRSIFSINDNLSYYLTIGPRYFFVRVHNHSTFVPEHMHEDGCGGFANTGLLYTLCDHFTFDVFGEYSYKRLHFHSNKPNTQGHTVQVGGLTFGGGFGYSF